MYVRPLVLYTFNLFFFYTFNLYNAVYQLYLDKLKKKNYLKAEISNRLEETPALCETLDYRNSS